MRKALGVLLVVLFCGCAVAPVVPDKWQIEQEVFLKEGVIKRVFISPQGEKGAIIYLRETPVYRQWQEKGQVFASVQTESGWMKGKPLQDYAPFDGRKIVFFLLVEGRPRKFEFLLN